MRPPERRRSPSHPTYKAIHVATGEYEVDFANRILTGCAFFATVGIPGNSGVSPPGYATVVGRAGNASAVFVETFNPSGVVTDLGFHLQTAC